MTWWAQIRLHHKSSLGPHLLVSYSTEFLFFCFWHKEVQTCWLHFQAIILGVAGPGNIYWQTFTLFQWTSNDHLLSISRKKRPRNILELKKPVSSSLDQALNDCPVLLVSVSQWIEIFLFPFHKVSSAQSEKIPDKIVIFTSKSFSGIEWNPSTPKGSCFW